jgi:tRNA (guanine37-N1)-methyltransferase
VTIRIINLRDFAYDRHKTTDDLPYGGGGGMVMKIEPIARALVALTTVEDHSTGAYSENETRPAPVPSIEQCSREPTKEQIRTLAANRQKRGPRIVLTDPRGPHFTQEIAQEWAQEPHLILLCGHYEGVDDRVRQHLITDEISIGDYILTGGELPALVIVDALVRLQPGALGDAEAPQKDTFAQNLLEYPHYTRPRDYFGWKVPDILLCGHHAQIARWRRWQQLRATYERRPDLMTRGDLPPQDQKLISSPEPTAPPDAKAGRHSAGDAHTFKEETPRGHCMGDEEPPHQQPDEERYETQDQTQDGRQEETDGTGI